MWAAKLDRCEALEILCRHPSVIINSEAGWVRLEISVEYKDIILLFAES
jgi:hypothetical protein